MVAAAEVDPTVVEVAATAVVAVAITNPLIYICD
jgi:hypothetical protein